MLHKVLFPWRWSRLMQQPTTGCYYSTRPGSVSKRTSWFGIPVSLGLACIGLLQLYRVLGRERGEKWVSPQPVSWQLAGFLMIPTRPLSRAWGSLMNLHLPVWSRAPLLGLYSCIFQCNLAESDRRDYHEYESFSDLFTRHLKEGAREFDENHELVCPCDGKVLHFGKVHEENDLIEQVKGVQYSLSAFLGPGLLQRQSPPDPKSLKSATDLYHVVIYLGPGDNHHFYSPADWSLGQTRHIPGELLTVAPWAARTMPGLFALNERVILSGKWKEGFFSFAAVGAYNVGSIHLSMNKDLRTNHKGGYKFGSYTDKGFDGQEGGGGEGREKSLTKGHHLGHFNMGSSIVLIFEGPRDFKFAVQKGESVKIGSPLGRIEHPNVT